MSEALLYVVSAAGVMGIVFGFLSRQQLKNVQAIADESTSRFEKERLKKEQYASQVKQAQDDTSKIRTSLSQQEKKLASTQKKLQEKDQELETLKKSHQEELTTNARNVDHLSEQNATLMSQISEVVKEKKQLQIELEKSNKQPRPPKIDVNALKDETNKLTKQLANARKENKLLKREVEKAREILSKLKPGEIKRYKTKAARMEQLYTSMKGLREMAEERNDNWDKALRILASHQLGNTETNTRALPILVAEALENIGANLIIDEHSHSGQAEPLDESAVTHQPVAESSNEATI